MLIQKEILGYMTSEEQRMLKALIEAHPSLTGSTLEARLVSMMCRSLREECRAIGLI